MPFAPPDPVSSVNPLRFEAARARAVVLARAVGALETTAGQGSCLGHRFDHIAQVVDGCACNPRLGVCLDTCHIFVAGYDIRDEESYNRTFDSFGSIIGFDKLSHLDVLYCADPSIGFRLQAKPYLRLLPRYRALASLERDSFRIGAATTGPGRKSTSTPIPGIGVKMSEKKITASEPTASIG